jgi:hypothetical protein
VQGNGLGLNGFLALEPLQALQALQALSVLLGFRLHRYTQFLPSQTRPRYFLISLFLFEGFVCIF